MMSLRPTQMSSRATHPHRSFASLLFWLLTIIVTALTPIPHPALAAPQLILPTPPGEAWKVIQGYACGTHNAWDRYSLDLANTDGRTYDAPVRAAAGGEVWHWEGGSGTLILNHGGQFFTMYTHLARAVNRDSGHYYEAGEILGYAGDRGAPGIPHLHFTAFTANRDGWSGRKSVPLSFAEGYDLPEVGGCNQHGGKVMTAVSLQPPQISFNSSAQVEHWYNGEQRIEFSASWAGGGLSQAWDKELPADKPMFPRHTDGYALLSEAGEGSHLLYVRVWGPDGKQSTATFGPIGYDVTAPSAPPSIGELKVAHDLQIGVGWQPGYDSLSGVAGYRVYVGSDPNGSSDWFSAEPMIKTPPLQTGRYLVRVQTIDNAGNSSAWTTIGSVVVE